MGLPNITNNQGLSFQSFLRNNSKADKDAKKGGDRRDTVATYAAYLEARIAEPTLSEEARNEARNEKRSFDNMSPEQKERWAIYKSWNESDAGAGLYSHGLVPPQSK